ncbi:CU044_5270 family protein [Actinomadura kijaniata]|uniref:CU044_5270 family protein n=1 Tax=Actinomadura kijaniata TaxID=46161 RepID=UPI00082EC5C6|nr:CU044_5270 family protein [Actinomadura kijaniata]
MNVPDALERLARANPVPTDGLGDTAETPRARALRADILATRPRRRRLRLLVAVPLTAAVAVVTALAVLWPEPIPRQTVVTGGEARAVLLAAAQRAAQPERTGRYWHTRGEVSQLVHRDHDGNRYTLLATTPTESWHPVDRREDGVFSVDVGGSKVQPLTPADAAAYRRDGSPQPGDMNPDTGLDLTSPPSGPGLPGDPVYEGRAEELPTDPARMRWAMLEEVRTWRGLPDHPEAWLFREGARLLGAQGRPLPASTRVALFRMLASLPGTRSLGTVRDPAGRPALAVALTERTGDLGTLEWQLFLSPSRDMLMATRAVVVEPGDDNRRARPGSPQYQSVVKQAGWTDRRPGT